MVREDIVPHIIHFLSVETGTGWERSANQILGYLMALGFDVSLEDLVDTIMDGVRSGQVNYGSDGYFLVEL